MDMEGLEETAQMVLATGAKLTTAKLDVADKQAFFEYAEKVIEDHGSVQIVVNNAGVALTATIDDMDFEDFEWLFNINFWGNGLEDFFLIVPILRMRDLA